MNSAIALFQVKEIIYNDFENKCFYCIQQMFGQSPKE